MWHKCWVSPFKSFVYIPDVELLAEFNFWRNNHILVFIVAAVFCTLNRNVWGFLLFFLVPIFAVSRTFFLLSEPPLPGSFLTPPTTLSLFRHSADWFQSLAHGMPELPTSSVPMPTLRCFIFLILFYCTLDIGCAYYIRCKCLNLNFFIAIKDRSPFICLKVPPGPSNTLIACFLPFPASFLPGL